LLYHMNRKGNGLYLFVIGGEVEAGGQLLGRRDAAGMWECDEISIKATKDSFLLLLDIPMN